MHAKQSRPDDTSIYDRLADLIQQGPAQGTEVRRLAPVVDADLRARQDLARAPAARQTIVEEGAIEILRSHPFMGARWKRRTPLYLFAWIVCVGFLRSYFGGWTAAIVLTGLVFLALVLEARRNARRSAYDPDARSCPGCSYDLSGLPDALPLDVVDGRVGPRRCPECGWAWPLVP